MDSLNPKKPPQLMKPEGSRKIVVLNGSCQIDQVIRGEWITLKVLPENGLPRGIYQLSEAQRPDMGKDGKLKESVGPILFSDSRSVFQLSSGKIIQHNKTEFEALIRPETTSFNIGSNLSVSYLNGRISEIKGNQAQESKQDQKASKKTVNHGHSL